MKYTGLAGRRLQMSEQLFEKELYERARRRVAAKKGFFIHLSVYIIVNAFLFVVWAVTGSPFPWFIFPLCGWGVGVIIHGLAVFLFSGTSDWEVKEVEKEVERMKKISR
jgi:hypothetical protein